VPIWTHDDEVKEGGKFEISFGGGNYRTSAPKRILPKDGNCRTSAPKVLRTDVLKKFTTFTDLTVFYPHPTSMDRARTIIFHLRFSSDFSSDHIGRVYKSAIPRGRLKCSAVLLLET
jgi:hypothetical protein